MANKTRTDNTMANKTRTDNTMANKTRTDNTMVDKTLHYQWVTLDKQVLTETRQEIVYKLEPIQFLLCLQSFDSLIYIYLCLSLLH
jgi:hypothetical protein